MKLKSFPEDGTQRIVTRFAFLPVELDDKNRTRIWLEFYKVILEYVSCWGVWVDYKKYQE